MEIKHENKKVQRIAEGAGYRERLSARALELYRGHQHDTRAATPLLAARTLEPVGAELVGHMDDAASAGAWHNPEGVPIAQARIGQRSVREGRNLW